MRPSLAASVVPFVLAFVLLAGGCNRHVFEVQPKACVTEEQVALDVDLGNPVDILFVVDDSGSMAEEQQALAAAFYRETCPFLTTAVPDIPDEYRNPTDEQLRDLAGACGFIQIQGAYERDFRVGITTTTVDECDNRYGVAPADWGRRERRGCLVAPAGGPRFVAYGQQGMVEQFRESVAQVGTWGSAFERGLDSAALFFDEGAQRAPGCQDDLLDFRRPGADLAIVFLTDEDDCSRDGPLPAQARALADEVPYRSCAIEAGATPTDSAELTLDARECYAPDVGLADVEHYARLFERAAGGGELRLAVIGGAGGVAATGERVEPAGCLAGPIAPDTACFESGGQSNIGSVCSAQVRGEEAPCCQADAAHRYFQLRDVTDPDAFLGDSLCSPSFADTLTRVAAFIARSDSLRLSEPPLNPAAIVVRVRRVDGSVETVPPGDGWTLDGARIRFSTEWTPRPGESVAVSALSRRDGDSECPTPAGPQAH
jgi:hypothetical protein